MSSVFVALCTAVGVFNYRVDPYLVFGRPLKRGFNAIKPKLSTNEILIKLGGISLYKPDGLIFGMSTARDGYDPTFSAWHGMRMMNFGVGASTPYQWLRFLQHANSVTHVKTVFVALNFVAFNANYEAGSRAENGFHDDLIAQNLEGTFNIRTSLLFRSLFTGSAIKASYETWRESQLREIWAAPEDKTLDLSFKPKRKKVMTNLSHFKNAEGNILEKHLRAGGKGFSYKNPMLPYSSIESLNQIIRYCRQHEIQLTLAIEPYHSRTLTLIHSAGFWEDFENWKRQLTKSVDADSIADPKKSKFILRDFATFSKFASENVPIEEMQEVTYWPEGFHYSPALGDQILQLSLGNNVKEPSKPGQFGFAISNENIDEHLRCIQKDLEALTPKQ